MERNCNARPLGGRPALASRTAALTLLLLAVLALALPVSAQVDDRFPNSENPDPRVGTPNDPEFDCSEPDDEDADAATCANIFAEQYNLFGFAPASTRTTARYLAGPMIGRAQISGTRADLAWKRGIGSPEITIAIIDTGVRWDDADIRRKVWLNIGELPLPEDAETYDADGDGAVTVDDWAQDSRVADANDNGLLDGQDLIRAFSDGDDADNNGYVDDIAGWDFFDDDNDPADVSSYSSSVNHGTGRAQDAAEQTHDGRNKAGVCPRCRVMMLRLWDTFVTPGDQYAMATVYAADNGADVQEVALGVIQNTRSAKQATEYARGKGMALMQVSSDLNTASHNYPTNYVGTVFINGCVPDSFGTGLEIPGLSDILNALGILDTQVPPTTYFRQSNFTQYGGHGHICMVGDTGSFATGQAAGAAGLLMSHALATPGGPLSGNEVKQLLTLTAEDVLPANGGLLPFPDPSQPGWDERFGYGRADLDAASAAIAESRIPPEALITSPPWWHLLDPVANESIAVTGEIAARRSSGWDYELQYALGLEPTEADFRVVDSGTGSQPFEGQLGSLPLAEIAADLPGSSEGAPPADINEFVITVRLVVHDADGVRGEDRKTYHVYHDPSAMPGWPKFTDTGGETSLVFYDLDGDGDLEIVDADSSGTLNVYDHDGSRSAAFNGGEGWRLPPPFNYHPEAPGFASGAVIPPTGGWRTPAIDDVDNDLRPEIVATAGDGRLWVIELDGTVAEGFPVSVDPALSAPALRSRNNHVKRGFLGAPTIADLDRDGAKEIIASAFDGHVYVWSAGGDLRPGFPVRLADPEVGQFMGGEIIATPAVGDLDGDGDLEIVSGSSEVYPVEGGAAVPSASFQGLVGGLQGLVTNLLSGLLGGSSRLYAIEDDGRFVDGWPVAINGILPDILPLVGPNHAVAVGDLDADGADEVVASITTGPVNIYEGDGSLKTTMQNQVAVATLADMLEQVTNPSELSGTSLQELLSGLDVTVMLNLFEYPVLGDLDADGQVDVASGGASALMAVNILLSGLNLPFSHVMQAWDPRSTLFKPGYPEVTEDYQLLSTPAIADVDGNGTREIAFGTGLYLLNAYGQGGRDAEGFPKLTGGWMFATPAIGDVDADGQLEIGITTREGYRFLWDLDAPATPESNSEWWTEGHDQCHSNNYGTDCRPPSRIADLAVADGALTFTAPGDDWGIGQAAAYQVRTADFPIQDATDWEAATPVADIPAPQQPGATESLELTSLRSHVAVVAVDEQGNRGQLASLRLRGRTTAENGGGDGGCSLGNSRDVGLPLLLLLALLGLAVSGRRRRTCGFYYS